MRRRRPRSPCFERSDSYSRTNRHDSCDSNTQSRAKNAGMWTASGGRSCSRSSLLAAAPRAKGHAAQALLGLDELFATMTRGAAGMDPGKVKREDVARSGGPSEAE